MTDTNVDDLVDDYLRRLDGALAALPTARRQQLMAEISEHLAEARSDLPGQTEAAVRELLDRVGPPEDIAAEALADQPTPARRPNPRPIIGVVVVAALVLAGAVGVLARRRDPARQPLPPTTVVPAAVPDVAGKPVAEASSELANAGLAVATEVQASTAAPANVVLSQAPPGGSRVAPGSVVKLTVSGGPPPSAVTSTAPVARPSTTLTPSALPDGIYVAGGEGTPHYFISLKNAAGGGVSGSVSFLYQDGQTSVVFTFDGIVQSGVATLHPISIPQNGGAASQNPATVPSVLSATLGSRSISLGECTSYLHFTESLAQCQFTFSSRGP